MHNKKAASPKESGLNVLFNPKAERLIWTVP
ncbi:hypothetical protein predicted by Glimmer/Critica [Acetobacter ghanensis]|uniref:Uncharacterized protein n=1 Tax=Acetobacter ghanensis TaxID=431306 RepID=A0A0U5F5Y2_9PROT|nr:hypothetical protein predicted by Glimmer/Critica [Acetobacter ghanensis]